MEYTFKDPEGRLDAWLDAHPSVGERTRVLSWLFELIEEPESVQATPVPIAMGLPLWTVIVPGTRVAVTYALIKSPPYPPEMAAIVLRRVEAVDHR